MADKTIGVEAMDLVYKNTSLCLAVLQCKITSQEQISALAKAMDVSLHPVLNETEWRKWIEYLDREELIVMAEVIEMITEDDYFSRAWIVQENTVASATILLLRCDSTLSYPDSMGSLEGEIQLPLCEFRVVCAKRWLALLKAPSKSQYGIMNERWHDMTMTGSLTDKNDHPHDLCVSSRRI